MYVYARDIVGLYYRVMITFIIMSNNNTHTHVTHTDFVVARRRTEDRAQGH